MSVFKPVVYSRLMTPFYTSLPEEIKFSDVFFTTQPKVKWVTKEENEEIGVFDVNRYNKKELQQMISSFVEKYDFQKMKKKIQKYKKKHIKYKERFPPVYEITEEYYEQFKCNQITSIISFTEMFRTKDSFRKRRIHQFRDITNEHISYFGTIMKKQKTRNYNLEQKMDLMKRRFPDLSISRSTLHNI